MIRADDDGGNRTLVPAYRSSISMWLISITSPLLLYHQACAPKRSARQRSQHDLASSRIQYRILQLDSPRRLLAHSWHQHHAPVNKDDAMRSQRAGHPREPSWKLSTWYRGRTLQATFHYHYGLSGATSHCILGFVDMREGKGTRIAVVRRSLQSSFSINSSTDVQFAIASSVLGNHSQAAIEY